jgi:hypothetical protein
MWLRFRSTEKIAGAAKKRMFVMSKERSDFLERRRPGQVDCAVTVALPGE